MHTISKKIMLDEWEVRLCTIISSLHNENARHPILLNTMYKLPVRVYMGPYGERELSYTSVHLMHPT